MASVADPDPAGSEPFFYRFGQKWTGFNIEVNRVECFEGASNYHTKTLLNNFFCQIDQCNFISKKKEKIRDFYGVKYTPSVSDPAGLPERSGSGWGL